jgi:hypothetical protein
MDTEFGFDMLRRPGDSSSPQNVCVASPADLLDPTGASALGHVEPFGVADTVVLVDSAAELLAEMNASNGRLVASIADDEQLAQQGALVGGELLVHAVTQGPPAEHLFGNFPDYQRYPTV